jgi:hypothetical protein
MTASQIHRDMLDLAADLDAGVATPRHAARMIRAWALLPATIAEMESLLAHQHLELQRARAERDLAQTRQADAVESEAHDGGA